jgi:apolipoprotein N-acyltransferase
MQSYRNFEKHVEFTRRVVEAKPDLIVWPEAAIYEGLFWDVARGGWIENAWYRDILQAAREAGTRVVMGLLILDLIRKDGKPDPVASTWSNSAIDVDPVRNILGRYDKVHLVPFSETFPFGTQEIVYRFSDLRLASMKPGKEFPVWTVAGQGFGVQICFEAIFPEISRESARNGAAFIVNISNDGWFRDSAELDQMLAMARFRAVEIRKPLIRATNTGISAFIDPAGRVGEMIPGKEVEGVLVGRVKLAETWSLFRAWGGWAGWLAAGALAGALACRIFVDRKRGGA